MQRQIKFRVWDKILGKYTNHCNDKLQFLTSAGSVSIYELFELETFEGYKDCKEDIQTKNINNFVLQQFTGLLDKNNKEIYEGDIILDEGAYMQIIWDAERLTYGEINSVMNCELNFNEAFKTKTEIVGNIFENPELLKYEN